MAKLTPAQIKAAQARGASTSIVPKHVSVAGMDKLAAELQRVSTGNAEVLSTIERLISVIANKESKDLDGAGIIEALMSLKHERQPLDIEMTFERDNRSMLKSGIRFKEMH
tara:strand:+ start:2060 stop:2392 length:333 start_codon:yes stop_codon:yes gene_type:complete